MTSFDFDLSRLPEPLRQKLQARLDRLPSELREKLLANLGRLPPRMLDELLERGSPMLDKLLDRFEQELPVSARPTATPAVKAKPSVKSASSTPASRYNTTVQRGDRQSLSIAAAALIVVGVLFLLYRLFVLGG